MAFLFGGYGASAATAAIGEAQVALDARMVAAMGAVDAATAAVNAAVFRAGQAKAHYAMLNKMDADWFQAIDTKATLTPEEGSYFNKYRFTFRTGPNGQPDYDSGSEALEADIQRAFADVYTTEDAVGPAKFALQQAKADLAAAQAAVVANNKKHSAAIEADNKAAAAAAAQAAAAAAANTPAALAQRAKSESTKKMVVIAAAVGVPVLLIAGYMLTRKKAAVAGYRRRRSRR